MGLTYEQAKMLGIGHEHPDSPEQQAIRVASARGDCGRWTLDIPGWRPTLANELVKAERRHWGMAATLKKRDAKKLIDEAVAQKVPPASRKRLVRFVIYCPSKFPDKDAPLKSFLDGLTTAGLILDDSETWCEWEKPSFRRGPKRTIITLEDME